MRKLTKRQRNILLRQKRIQNELELLRNQYVLIEKKKNLGGVKNEKKKKKV